jgi:PII-like signaling protein
MKLPEKGKLLRIFIDESDKLKGVPLYEAIILETRRLDIAGGTVFRGIMGFGANSRMHTSKILRLSEDMPVVVEIVDVAEKIELLMPFLDMHVK